MDKKSILIFGVGPLQKSLIERCKQKGLFTVGIDPAEDASCKFDVDAFEIVDGQDFEKTIEIAEKFKVDGIITAATDKPLVMMARVADKLNLPFFSVKTAKCSTDKYLMKQKFQEAGIPCAKGFLLNNFEDLLRLSVDYPVIVKPRDNSGSRGVIYCENYNEVEYALQEAMRFTYKDNVLVEEFIEGKEYSVEGIHYNGESHVIQITEKITTAFPYNVELGHIQPADITADQQKNIQKLITEISQTLGFLNCASHTEIKINSKGILVIESSPRLGGDFISSTLVPLSTGINMEDILIDVAINSNIKTKYYDPIFNKCSGITYFELPEGIITSLTALEYFNEIPEIQEWQFDLKIGDRVNNITSSLNRYGYAIFNTQTRKELVNFFNILKNYCKEKIIINR